MKNYTMFNYDYLLGDHASNVSKEAKLLYIEMSFFANNGFVANPRKILDSLSLDYGYLQELINNGDVLTIKGRSEVFLAAFFVHNKGADPRTWIKTPYGIYWKGRLHCKKNGVATLDGVERHPEQYKKETETNDEEKLDWDAMINELERKNKNED